MGTEADTPWHGLPDQEVLGLLGTSADGLANSDAVARLAAHGPNSLPESRGVHPVRRFLAQFNSALIYFLLAAALAAVALSAPVPVRSAQSVGR